MILSTNQEMDEYTLVREPDHIAKVWAAVEPALPDYWEKFVKDEQEAELFTAEEIEEETL